MAKTDFKSVDKYIASQPDAAQSVLELVRSSIRKAVPNAKESISCNIPTYKLRGDPVIYFAGWKQHYSLYPATNHLVATLKNDLAAYEVKKGTIRFPLSQPVPVKLIECIAKMRATEVAEGEKAKIPCALCFESGLCSCTARARGAAGTQTYASYRHCPWRWACSSAAITADVARLSQGAVIADGKQDASDSRVSGARALLSEMGTGSRRENTS